MRIEISPSIIKGSITAPPSKSITHRAIICASLSQGESIINNINICDDTLATIESMKRLGASIEIINNKLIVKGINLNNLGNKVELVSGSSASTLRFIMPLATHLFKFASFKVKNDLFLRPLEVYEKLYSSVGGIKKESDCVYATGDIDFNEYIIEGSHSSQYITGLLFLLPILNHDSKIIIKDELVSKSYLELTIDILKKFGIALRIEENEIHVKGKQIFRPTEITIEGDYSLAANFLALGATVGEVKVNGLTPSSLQGDKKIIEILKNMGCNIEIDNDSVKTTKSNLIHTNLDLIDNVDLAMPFAYLAALSQGKSTISNCKRLIYKESNRFNEIINVLKKFNVNVDNDLDNIYIENSNPKIKEDEIINVAKDHRIILLSILLAIKSNTRLIIEDITPINKSYPLFVEDLKKIGANIRYLE